MRNFIMHLVRTDLVTPVALLILLLQNNDITIYELYAYYLFCISVNFVVQYFVDEFFARYDARKKAAK